MNHLLSITNATDRAAVAETNAERTDESLAFMHKATKVAGVPNMLVGPPTAGTYPADDLWVDSIGGVWRCTVAGTPGTWAQLLPAIVAAFPGGAVAGYRVIRTDLNYAEFYYTGAAWAGVYLGAVHTEGNGAPGGGTPGFSYFQVDSAPKMWWVKVGGVWIANSAL